MRVSGKRSAQPEIPVGIPPAHHATRTKRQELKWRENGPSGRFYALWQRPLQGANGYVIVEH